MSLFRILLMQQKKYKDATHWITVGGNKVSLGYRTGSYGSLEPTDIFVGASKNTINRLILEDIAEEDYRFSLLFKDKVGSGYRNFKLYMKNLASDIAFTVNFNNAYGVNQASSKPGSPVESFFTADDLGKTIPLKIEITVSSGSGTTQPAKPDPGLE